MKNPREEKFFKGGHLDEMSIDGVSVLEDLEGKDNSRGTEKVLLNRAF